MNYVEGSGFDLILSRFTAHVFACRFEKTTEEIAVTLTDILAEISV